MTHKTLLDYYSKMGFHLESINPFCKTPVSLPVNYCLRHGGNIALGYEKESKWLVLDRDSQAASRVLDPIFHKTPVVKSAKGYGIIIRADKVSSRISLIVSAYKNKFRGEGIENLERWMQLPSQDIEWFNTFFRRCVELGFTDETFIKGLSPDFDKHSYYLLPPSVTCRWEGANGVIVKLHSTNFPFCNSSPTKEHDFIVRTWLNRTEDSITFTQFLEAIGVRVPNVE